MQRIDRTVGPSLGNLLLWLRPLFHRKKSSETPNSPVKKILVLKFLGLGTLLLGSPTLRRLKEIYPGSELVLLTITQNQAMAEMLPSIDRVVVISLRNLGVLLTSLWAVLPKLAREKFDVIIDLEFFANFSALIAAYLTLFHPAAITAGYDFPGHWRNDVFKKRLRFHHQKHISEIMLDFPRLLVPGNTTTTPASFEAERLVFIKEAQTAPAKIPGIDLRAPGFVITLNINSGDLCMNRKWPKEYFRTVVTELQKKENLRFYLTGGSQDIPYVEAFLDSLPRKDRIVNLCGKTSFHQLLGLLWRSDLFITNDSGPIHVAAVMNIPSIAFFGPETPLLYGPVGNRSHVFYRELPCSPCLTIHNSKYSLCRDNQCLKMISSAEVLEVIHAEINSSQRV